MTPEIIASVAHEVNRAYCESLGDMSQREWDSSDPWQQLSAISGVRKALEDPTITPEAIHQHWMDEKLKEGWVYGPEKNAAKKTHPCLLPYNELPQSQRTKDSLFLAVIRSMATHRVGKRPLASKMKM